MAKKPSGDHLHLLALGMFAWGFFKAVAFSRSQQHDTCPVCEHKHTTDPRAFFHLVVKAPLLEELTYRRNYPALMNGVSGLVGSTLPMSTWEDSADLMFAVGHASPRLGALGNTLRVCEAGLAGSLVYRPAYNAAGFLGAAVVHAAHNLGTSLARLLDLESQIQAEGWETVHEPAPGLTMTDMSTGQVKEVEAWTERHVPRRLPGARKFSCSPCR